MLVKKTSWRLNFRFTAILFAVLAAGCVGLHFWHEAQVAQSGKVLLKRADEEELQGELTSLIRTLRSYLQLVPNDDDAWRRLADVQDKESRDSGDLPAAAEVYARVLARPNLADDIAMRERYARVLWELRSYPSAIEQADLVTEAARSKPAVNAQVVRALAKFDQGEIAAALTDWNAVENGLSKAIELQPPLADEIELVSRLARLYRTADWLLRQTGESTAAPTQDARNARADQSFAQLIGRHPDAASPRLAHYQYLRAYELPGTEVALRAAIERAATGDINVWLAEAEDALLKANGQVEGLQTASQGFQNCIETAPADRRGYLGQIRVLLLLESSQPNGPWHGQAEKVVSDAIHKFGANDFELKLWQGRVQWRGADQAQFTKTLQELEDISITNELVWSASIRARARAEVLRLRAENLLHQGDYAEAAATLEQLLKLEQRIPVEAGGQGYLAASLTNTWILLGRCHQAMGEPDRAAQDFEQGLRAKPTDSELRISAFRAWVAAGRRDLAAVYQEPGLGKASPEELIIRAEHLVRTTTDLPAEQRDWSGVRKLLEGLEKENRTRVRAGILAAHVEIQSGNAKTAIETVKHVETPEPTAPSDWRLLVFAFAGLGANEDADRCVKRYQQVANPADVAILQSELLQQRQQVSAAEQVLRDALPKAIEEQKHSINLCLARLLAGQLRSADAKKVLATSCLGKTALHRDAVRLYAGLCLVDQDWAGLSRAEELLSAIDGPQGTESKYFRARRLLETAESNSDALKEVESLAKDLAESRADWIETIRLGALLAERKGNVPQAIEMYERAMRISAGTEAETQLADRLVQLALSSRANQSDELTTVVINAVASSAQLSIRAIARALAEGNIQRALRIATEASRLRPRDAVAQLWLGNVLLLAGRDAEAERAVRQATLLNPSFQLAWESWVGILVQSGKVEDGKSALATLEQNTKLGEPARSLLLARCQISLNDTAQADQTYRRLLEKLPESGEVLLAAARFYSVRDSARSVELARKAHKLSPNSVSARQTLATVLAVAGTAAGFEEAQSVLGAVANALPTEETDLRLFAQLRARRPERQLRSQGIEILATLVHRKSFVPSQQRIELARLYAAEEQHDKALTEMAALINQSRLTVPSQLIDFLTHALKYANAATPEQMELATKALARLEELQPEAWTTESLKIRNAKRLGQNSQIESMLEAYSVRIAPESKSVQERVAAWLRIAELCTDMEEPALAEKYLRRAGEAAPSAKLALAGHLARRATAARIEEAIELCLNSADAVGLRNAAAALCGVLIDGAPSEAQLAKSEPFLQAALAKYPDDAELLFAVGSYQLMRGHAKQAVSMLKRTLELSPTNVLAMNNLAYALASEKSAEEALTLVDRAIAVQGVSSSFLDTRALALIAQGDFKQALEIYDELVKNSNVDPVVYVHRAAAQFENGQPEAARESMAKARKLESNLALFSEPDKKRLTQLENSTK